MKIWIKIFPILDLEEQLDFPVLYASAKEGWASTTYTKDPPADARNMSRLLDAIISHVPPPTANLEAPFQMLVGIQLLKNVFVYLSSPYPTSLFWAEYVGWIHIIFSAFGWSVRVLSSLIYEVGFFREFRLYISNSMGNVTIL